MEQKKSKKLLIIIIALIVIILILVGVFAYLYFTTDILKSNKQLFVKYGAQLFEEKNSFFEKSLDTYFEKQKNTPYENKGEFTTKLENVYTGDAQKTVDNFNISFKGKNDPLNQKIEENISINYSDKVTFPLNYRQVKNMYGLQTKYVGSKYITINNDAQIPQDSQGIIASIQTALKVPEQKIELQFSDSELTDIRTRYMTVLNNNLDDTKFSKISSNNQTGYKLTISYKDFYNLLIKLLEELKNDQVVLGKVNSFMSENGLNGKIDSTTIDKAIESINEQNIEEGNLEITIYSTNGKMNKIEIKIGSEIAFSISKVSQNDSLEYNFNVNVLKEGKEFVNINLKALYSGLSALTNVSENYELNIKVAMDESDTIQCNYIIFNTTEFKDSVTIENLSEENSMILNNQTKEAIDNLFKAIGERLVQVNALQMKEIGFPENQNIFAALNPISIIMNKTLYNMATNTMNSDAISDLETTTFNQKYELYVGEDVRGTQVKGLLTLFSTELESDNKLKELSFDGQTFEITEQNITLIKSNIDTSKSYKVEFEKDQNSGKIYRAVINVK